MERPGHHWKIKLLPPPHYNNLAKDGYEIRHVFEMEDASVVHCTLPPK